MSASWFVSELCCQRVDNVIIKKNSIAPKSGTKTCNQRRSRFVSRGGGKVRGARW